MLKSFKIAAGTAAQTAKTNILMARTPSDLSIPDNQKSARSSLNLALGPGAVDRFITVPVDSYRRVLRKVQAQERSILNLKNTLESNKTEAEEQRKSLWSEVQRLSREIFDLEDRVIHCGGVASYPRSFLRPIEFATESFVNDDSALKVERVQWPDMVMTSNDLQRIFIDVSLKYVSTTVPTVWTDKITRQRDSRYVRFESILANYFIITSSNSAIARDRLRRFIKSADFWRQYFPNSKSKEFSDTILRKDTYRSSASDDQSYRQQDKSPNKSGKLPVLLRKQESSMMEVLSMLLGLDKKGLLSQNDVNSTIKHDASISNSAREADLFCQLRLELFVKCIGALKVRV